jgi:hypothetical protein
MVTGNQLNMLLGIVDCLAHKLMTPGQSYDGEEPKRLDGEVKIALETSTIKTLALLDAVIEDAGRWDAKRVLKLERDAERLMRARIAFLKSQKESADHIRRPSFRLGPKLVRVKDGSYAVFLGNLDDGTALVGQGETVEDAFRAFDKICEGKTPDAMAEWLKKQSNKTTGNTQHEKRPLDIGTSDATPDAEIVGKDDTGNCERPGRRRVSDSKQTRQNRKRKGLSDYGSGPQSPS